MELMDYRSLVNLFGARIVHWSTWRQTVLSWMWNSYVSGTDCECVSTKWGSIFRLIPGTKSFQAASPTESLRVCTPLLTNVTCVLGTCIDVSEGTTHRLKLWNSHVGKNIRGTRNSFVAQALIGSGTFTVTDTVMKKTTTESRTWDKKPRRLTFDTQAVVVFDTGCRRSHWSSFSSRWYLERLIVFLSLLPKCQLQLSLIRFK